MSFQMIIYGRTSTKYELAWLTCMKVMRCVATLVVNIEKTLRIGHVSNSFFVW